MKQGGQLPAASTAYRTAGRIYVESGKTVTYTLFPTDATRSLAVELVSGTSTIVSSKTGTGNLIGTYTPTATGWLTLRAKNASTANPAQRAFVKATYTAPAVLTSTALRESHRTGHHQQPRLPAPTCWCTPTPPPPTASTWCSSRRRDLTATLRLADLIGRLVHEQRVRLYPGSTEQRLHLGDALPAGVYQLSVPELNLSRKVVVQ